MTSVGKTIVALMACTLLSNNAIARNWGQDNNSRGATVENHKEVFFGADIEHLTNGTKTVVFYISPKEKSKQCDRFGAEGIGLKTQVIFYLNSQAINGSLWCYKIEDSTYYTFFASSSSGQLFVEKLFKVEEKPIAFKLSNIKLSIPTSGFTQVWNSISDDVL